jgi:hypothetical protein
MPDHLAQLIAIMVAFDKQKCRRLLLFQAPVTREDQAVLRARRPDQSVTGQVRPVDHVLADDTEPFGEAAEHSIRGEFQFSCCQFDSLILIDPL